MIPRNPTSLVVPPKTEEKEKQTWTIQEVNQFLHYTKNEPLHVAYLLAIYTGMRKGEILGLRWKDCDLEQGRISVKNVLARTSKELIFQEPKTKGSKRNIQITPDVIQALKQHKRKQNENRLKLGHAYQDHDLVVCTSLGTPMIPRNLTRHFDRMIKESGVPRIRFHDLRHSHATIMLQLGEHPKVVSERLGHSRTGITLDIYSHVIPTMQEKAAQNFSKALNNN
ncbi:site-specific integrase [Thermoflavimicrobium daqui]|uniref:Site-specific integrase n=1 Tax=Thermoflavimicrobium daqui TaxID=2137476 RepID=A0A364K6L5_9BACL|nr:site-specific integrase [Thermoflavimicrobium daqui]RAL25934.1 site-specific integrase [Thermoflavimicrobium daqui]